MRPQTPLEACMQIASDHAANTRAAIENEKRTAQLADRLEDYCQALRQLAGEHVGDDAGEQAEQSAGS